VSPSLRIKNLLGPVTRVKKKKKQREPSPGPHAICVFFFFFILVTGPRRSLSLKLSDTRVYEPQIPSAPPSSAAARLVTVLSAVERIIIFVYSILGDI